MSDPTKVETVGELFAGYEVAHARSNDAIQMFLRDSGLLTARIIRGGPDAPVSIVTEEAWEAFEEELDAFVEARGGPTAETAAIGKNRIATALLGGRVKVGEVVVCPDCGGEGRYITHHHPAGDQDWDEDDGPCLICKETGRIAILKNGGRDE